MKLTRERLEEIKARRSDDRFGGGPVTFAALDELIAHAEATLDDGWIKAEDRLPKEGFHVIVFDGDSMGFGYTARDEWFNICTQDLMTTQTTHWRELPEPPK